MRKAFCENCGSKIEDGARFCAVCGFCFENDDEEVIDNFADISSQSEISLSEEMPLEENFPYPVEAEPVKTVPLRKPSYKLEKILLVVSAICAVCSLAFYFIVTNFSGIPMKNKAPAASDIPELTVDMAEEILNNATDFPYQYFEKRNMINKNDYIIHPDFIEYASDGDYRCYAVDGIETKDDFFSYFEKYGTREFIEKSLDQSYFYVEKNSKIYFSDNFGMGWYPYSAASMFIEKIDDETYYVKSEEGIVEGVIFKYIDGTFKATTISAKEAYAPYDDNGASIYLPDIELGFGSTLDSVERELKNVGLKLNRDNIVYVKAYWGTDGAESYVTAFQKSYKKYKSGDYVGVVVAVEEPDFYGRGAKDGETIPELTKQEAVDILNKTCVPLQLYFSENNMLDESDKISVPHPYGDFDCDAVAVKGIETDADYRKFIKDYATISLITNIHSGEYVIRNGKFYLIMDDIDGFMFSERTLVLEKIDDSTYFALDTWYYIKNIIIYVDGKFKVSDITPEKARDLCNVTSSGVNIPDLENMSLSEAERELNKAGLKLDRSNITKIPGNSVDQFVISAKNSCKKVARGSSVGVYLAVNFADYEENSNNSESDESAELTDDYVREMLINASKVELKWLGFRYCFTDDEDGIGPDDADKVHYVDRNDYITYDDNGYTIKAYAVVDDDIKSVADLRALYSKYFDKEYTERRCSGYIDRNGKLYVAVGDAGLWEPCSEYNDDISKVNDEYYIYTLTGDFDGDTITVYYDVIFEDGKWVFTNKYEDTHGKVIYSGFMPVWGAENCIYD
ncbi:MAG: zinc-ribbon domain-containing protein [Clostridia bacterium]|nr:zinc-ribbon domain-containing protein [Clostridia bacterium]